MAHTGRGESGSPDRSVAIADGGRLARAWLAEPGQTPTSAPATSARSNRWAWSTVGLVVVWNLWDLRATLSPVSYLDDASVHQQMVRFATSAIRSGHDPLTQWFPFLGAGSPQFLHYQSLGAMLTGLAGTVIGPDTAFRWSLYLMVALWPIAIYASARVMRLRPWQSAAAAAMSPLLMSVPGVGYERQAYLWIGFGLWAQLWGSWALPFAWATTWRAMDDRRYLAPAALCVALTAALHFETGYLAFLAVLVFPFISPSARGARLRRAGIVLTCSLLAAAWVIVPLIAFGKWAAVNEVLRNSPLENGYGARTILTWLVTGRVYDAGRFPGVTVLVVVGILVVALRWRVDAVGRAFLVMWTSCLVLAFGRTTFGPLVNVIPGSSDLFFRRFLMGTQLAGLYLAGIGAVACLRAIKSGLGWISHQVHPGSPTDPSPREWAVGATAAIVVVALLVPGYLQIHRYDERNATTIDAQRTRESVLGGEIAPLIAYVKSHGGGRTYAGLPTNWGTMFAVGSVPVFKYLESQDVDEIGYTLRTASLMTDPEYYFDESNSSDYVLFGVRYLILPTGFAAPVRAQPVMRRGPYQLWVVRSVGYVSVVDTVGTLQANRANIASQTLGLLHSSLAARHQDLGVGFAGAAAPMPTAHPGPGSGPPGVVVTEHGDLEQGLANAVVDLHRRAVVMLSASYDPGWQVTVDGRVSLTQMLAPAVVGVSVGPGRHRVVFTFHGFAYYPELLLLGALSIAFVSVPTRRRRARSGREPTPPRGGPVEVFEEG